MRNEQPQNECGSGCGAIATERNRYFTGKFMAARDFQADQNYFLTHHRLHNRLLHGWGIVCGLEVRHHPDKDKGHDTDCARRWVIINAGVALDCCGRELTLPKMTAFKLPLPTASQNQYNPATREQNTTAAAEDVMREPFLIALSYHEEEIEQVAALSHESGCDASRKQANRIREGAKLVFIRLGDVEDDCWRMPGGKLGHRGKDCHDGKGGEHERGCHDDCPDPLPGPSGACLDPVCPCGHIVPLALIKFDPNHPEQGFEIDTIGRRRLPTPPHLLTHIIRTNWKHGEEITLKKLREEMNGRLVITFDRKIKNGDSRGTGVNGHTFIVEYGGIQRDIEFLPFDRNYPPHLEDECQAVFTISPDHIDKDHDNIAGNLVYVTLKCDFVLDCHDNPVDGDHLGGRLPSGDGTPGGKFESWFRVVHDRRRKPHDEYDEEEQWQQQREA